MTKLKVYKEKALPDTITVDHDGIWLVKPEEDTTMSMYVIDQGNVVGLDVIDSSDLEAATKGKADKKKVVQTSGNQNVSGVKTFIEIPQVNKDAKDDNELVRLAQINERFSAFEPPEQPKDGEDGKTPYIGENGNWWVGDEDTGVSASRPYTILYDRDISGLRNKSNHKFRASEAYVPGTLKVYYDGLLLSKGNNEDYTELDAGTSVNGATLNRVVSDENKLIFEFLSK